MPSFYEFFAGGGMARAGFGPGWDCLFANDFDESKAKAYRSNWGEDAHLAVKDVALVGTAELPGHADLAWASFPCQDLSLAGNYEGIGRPNAATRTRSGSFWAFWNLMRALGGEGRAPKIIVLENVYGILTANHRRDFAAIADCFARAGYRFGALVVDAKWFVPQSRPRVFVVGIQKQLGVPDGLILQGPDPRWHPEAMIAAAAGLSRSARRDWVWWSLPAPAQRAQSFLDLIEENPASVAWHTPEQTARLIAMMSEVNRQKLEAAKAAGRRMVGGVYKRTRVENGRKVQRAEVRFDDLSGCLRTPAGGSSRQLIVLVEGRRVRSRLLSTREAARLMGLPDAYKLPSNYNEAYHLVGDGVAVPVVAHIAQHLLQPLLRASGQGAAQDEAPVSVAAE